MVNTNETLHVCCYNKEHRPMARKLYGTEKVNEQIKEKVSCCNKCSMFSDLLLFVGIESTDAIIPNEDIYKVEGVKLGFIPHREGSNNKVKVLYHEVHDMTVEEFFKPPQKVVKDPVTGEESYKDIRWIDEL